MDNPTVFISYSHDNEEHKAWVLKLASDLRRHGVNAILDQWDLHIGNDLRFFMENGLSSSKLVLCICSQNYVQKVNTGKGGSGYEGMIITQPLLTDANSDFIIPIIRNNNSIDKVPKAFGSKLYIDFSDDDKYVIKYSELLAHIYGEYGKRKPPLGENPFNGDLSKQIDIKTNLETVKYHSPGMEGTVIFRFDNNNGHYYIGNGEYTFDTRWSRAGNNSIHAYGLIGYKPGEKTFPKLEDLYSYDYSSDVRTIKTGEILIIRNMKRHFAAVKLGVVKSASHSSPYDEMSFDYKIYEGI